MIFSDDSILMSLLERYDEENEIKDAVLSYCNRGAVTSNVGKKAEQMPQQQKSYTPSTSEGNGSNELDNVLIHISH